MNFFHSIIVTIAISFSALLSALGMTPAQVATDPAPSQIATTTEQVAEEAPTSSPSVTPARTHTPSAVLSVQVQTSNSTSTADVPAPVISAASTSDTAPIVIQVNVPAPVATPAPAPAETGSNITSQPAQSVPMETTYEITPPASAPQAALDLLGNHTKTLAEMRDFVSSLNPQLAFKKKMQSADADTLKDYLEGNGYTVDVHEAQ